MNSREEKGTIMQTENKILKLDGGVGSWCSEKGVLVATPSLAIGLAARFNLDLRTKELNSDTIGVYHKNSKKSRDFTNFL